MKIAILCNSTKKSKQLDSFIKYCKDNYILDTSKGEADINGTNVIVLFTRHSENSHDVYVLDSEDALYFHNISDFKIDEYSIVVHNITDDFEKLVQELFSDNLLNKKNYEEFVNLLDKQDKSLEFEYSNLFKDGKLYDDVPVVNKELIQKIFEQNKHIFGQVDINNVKINQSSR